MAMIPLASLATDLGSQSELEWYYQRAESAIGLRSSHESIVMRIKGGMAGYTPYELSTEDRRREAVRRMRRIHASLIRVPPHTQALIQAAFTPRAWGTEVRRWFRKPIDGIAFHLYGDLQDLIQKEKKENVRGRAAHCERLFLGALGAYGLAKREQRAAA